MANLIEDILWEAGIYQLEQTDLVIGGEDGISNTQAKQLANRTAWLKDKVGVITHFDDFAPVAATSTLDDTVIGKAVIIDANNATIAITLPPASGVRNGSIIPITAINVNKSQVAVSAPGVTKIKYGGTLYQTIYLDEAEQIWLITNGSDWTLMPLKFAMQNVGEIFYSYRVLPGTIALHGQLVNRADEARIWTFANDPAGATSLVTEVQWFSSLNYRGFFSKGNESTTLRLPDLRSQFIRGLDSSRGLSYGRTSSAAGGYEADNNKSHNHTYRDRYYPESGGVNSAPQREQMPNNYNNKFGSGDTDNDNTQWLYYDSNSGSSGGTEAVSKNIGLIPLMRK